MTSIVASVVVPIRRAGNALATQLEALRAQEGAPEFEVILVGAGTTPPLQTSRSSDSLHLRFIESGDTRSDAALRNIGAAVAHGPILLFCNDVDRVGSSWVRGMVQSISDDGADFVGGLLQVSRAHLADWIYDWRYRPIDNRCLADIDAISYPLGASFGVKRDAFDAVGGFDHLDAEPGRDEVDLTWRLLRHGFRLGEAPDAVVELAPSISARTAIRQERAHARASAALAASAGTLGPPLSLLDVGRRFTRSIARQVIRKRERRPTVVFSTGVSTFLDLFERRRAALTSGKAASTRPEYDFLAPPTAPSIGGLAFAATQAEEARWYAREGVEQFSLLTMEALLPPSGTFVDCGANVGVFTVAAALQIGRDGRVIALEPSPRSRSALEQNLERHGVAAGVELHAEAAGDVREDRVFHQYENSLLSGFGEAPSVFGPGGLLEESTVEVVPLDDLVAPPVDLLKIDVEGYEPQVLAGAQRLIDQSPGIALLVEFNPTSLSAAGHSVHDILQFFPEEQWRLFIIDDHAPDRAKAITPIRRDPLSSSTIEIASWYGNLLAVRPTGDRPVMAMLDDSDPNDGP